MLGEGPPGSLQTPAPPRERNRGPGDMTLGVAEMTSLRAGSRIVAQASVHLGGKSKEEACVSVLGLP